MPVKNLAIGKTVTLNVNFETALARTIEALKTEGFGVLTEIDVKETLKKKLDVDAQPYKILGACNPPLAHRALSIAPEIGLLLPCNVTVRYLADNVTEVALVSPMSMLGVIENPELRPIAAEAQARLERVGSQLESN